MKWIPRTNVTCQSKLMCGLRRFLFPIVTLVSQGPIGIENQYGAHRVFMKAAGQGTGVCLWRLCDMEQVCVYEGLCDMEQMCVYEELCDTEGVKRLWRDTECVSVWQGLCQGVGECLWRDTECVSIWLGLRTQSVWVFDGGCVTGSGWVFDGGGGTHPAGAGGEQVEEDWQSLAWA